MKILASSLAHSSRAGSESLVGYRIVEALASRYDTTLISANGMEKSKRAVTEQIPARIDAPNDVWPRQLLRFERLQRAAVKRLLTENEFDIVHRVTPSGWKDSLLPVPKTPLVLGPVLGSVPAPAAFDPILRPRLPVRYSPMAIATRIQNSIARRIFLRYSTLDNLIEHATLILVGTHVTMRRLPAHLHARCRWIPYAGVEHEMFSPPTRKRANNVPQLLFSGRLVRYKGVELLLRAAAIARRRCKFELTIIGSGNRIFRSHCERLASHLRLTDVVTFVANRPRSELVNRYQMADIFCMPSTETYGLAIVEAMSSACAVIVSDINGPGEIVQEGTGIKVPLVTPEQFIADYAARIEQLVDDVQLRSDLGAAAREHVIQHHDWKKIQSRLLEIYDETFPQRRVSENAFEAIATN